MKNISIMVYISCDHAEFWTNVVGITIVQHTDCVKLLEVYTQGLSHFIHDHYDSWCDIVQEFIKWVSKKMLLIYWNVWHFIVTMESSTALIFMHKNIMTDDRYSSVFLALEPLSIPHRPSHLPPIFRYKGGIHPHRKHRPQEYIGNTYIYMFWTQVNKA